MELTSSYYKKSWATAVSPGAQVGDKPLTFLGHTQILTFAPVSLAILKAFGFDD